MVHKITLVLADDAADLLRQWAGTPRKQGEFVTGLIKAEAARRLAVADLPAEVERLRREVQALNERLTQDGKGEK